jgi:pyruvate formate lyase activating enzyme
MASALTSIVCDLCPRSCRLEEGETGFCNVRRNEGGENVDALYGLFYPYPERYNEVAPGSYTIVFPGCNASCSFCDVPFISTGFNGDPSSWPGGAYRKLAPGEVVEKVKAKAGPERAGFTCGLMGLFGGEAILHHEYVTEAARLCREAGCASKIHINGFINEGILRKVLSVVDVVSVNVKGSGSPGVYQSMGVDFDVVLHSIGVACKTPNVRTQVTDLIGPDLLPSTEEAATFAQRLHDIAGSDIRVDIQAVGQPLDRFPDPWREGNPPPHGDEDPWRPLLCLKRIAETFAENGLTNVWAVDYTLGKERLVHVRDLKIVDAMLGFPHP